ncbi:GNAT family N-acetyltransferase [Candidatus Roizmanbacteria bacterium]|nr:GNAT family N-acetyltransferase [Candidatus Roizmanbacteria bacterium]
MATMSSYSLPAIPAHLKWQILSFQRLVWPEGFRGRDEFHPVTFVLTDNDVLLSHLQVVWKNLEHRGILYKTYGFSGVFTYPSHRRKGFASELIKAGSKRIEKQGDADIIFFTTTIEGLYEKAGFEKLEKAKVLTGDQQKPELYQEISYARFVSVKGRRGRTDFMEYPIYFGEHIW